jgi:hypothetical protein
MNLELERKILELDRVQLARKELEFKRKERLAEIEKLKEHIKVQEQKEIDLIDEINLMKEK